MSEDVLQRYRAMKTSLDSVVDDDGVVGAEDQLEILLEALISHYSLSELDALELLHEDMQLSYSFKEN